MIDLALILSDRLPDVNLEEMLLKMRDFETWNSYIVHDEQQKVLGGCLL